MVVLVIILTTFVVVIAYWIGLPYWWNTNKPITVFILILGNWLLMNVIFHYYMGVTTSPGFPALVYYFYYLIFITKLFKKSNYNNLEFFRAV